MDPLYYHKLFHNGEFETINELRAVEKLKRQEMRRLQRQDKKSKKIR